MKCKKHPSKTQKKLKIPHTDTDIDHETESMFIPVDIEHFSSGEEDAFDFIDVY